MARTTIESVFEFLQTVDKRQNTIDEALRGHMIAEEARYAEIRDEMKKTNNIINAFPEKEGKPDFFGHRVTHENILAAEKTIGVAKNHTIEKLIDMALFALIVILVTHGKSILELMK